MQEERKIDRRTPIVEPQDIQQRQAREGAPLYNEDHSEAPSHPTLEILADAQRTPQRSDSRRRLEQLSVHSDTSQWEDIRTLQSEVRRKRKELEETKRRCVLAESEIHNEKLKSCLLEQENESLRRELRKKEREKTPELVTNELDNLKAGIARKTQENQELTQRLSALKQEKEKFKEHLRKVWEDYENYKKENEVHRNQLEKALQQKDGTEQGDQVNKLLAKKAQISAELQRHKELIQSMQTEHKKEKQNLESNNSYQVQELQNQLDRAYSQIQTLTTQHQSTQKEVNKLKETLFKKKKKIEKLKSDLETSKQPIQETPQSQRQEITQESFQPAVFSFEPETQESFQPSVFSFEPETQSSQFQEFTFEPETQESFQPTVFSFEPETQSSQLPEFSFEPQIQPTQEATQESSQTGIFKPNTQPTQLTEEVEPTQNNFGVASLFDVTSGPGLFDFEAEEQSPSNEFLDQASAEDFFSKFQTKEPSQGLSSLFD